jgi:hypothetical protein
MLDWLAMEFIELGWSVKAIDRMIVLSSAYRQSTDHHEANAKIDPDNKLLLAHEQRASGRRGIRDSALGAGRQAEHARWAARPCSCPSNPRSTT